MLNSASSSQLRYLKKWVFLIAITLSVSSTIARTSVLLFPFNGKSGDELQSWVATSFPDVFYNMVGNVPSLKAFDPVFICNTENLAKVEITDSLIVANQKLWKWNFAISGSYKIQKNGNIAVDVIVTRFKEGRFLKKSIHRNLDISKMTEGVSGLFVDVLMVIDKNIEISKSVLSTPMITSNNSLYTAYAMGHWYEMHGMKGKAVSAYNITLLKDSDYIPALVRLGRLLVSSGKIEEAERLLKNAFSKSPGSSLIASELAKLKVVGNSPKDASVFVSQNSNLLEKTSVGLGAIGISYMDNGEYQRAISLLTRAVAMGAPDLEAEYNLGRAYMYSGDYNKATEIFTRLLNLDPEEILFHSFLGETNRRANRLMESVNILEKAFSFEPDNITNMLNLSHTYIDLKWYDKAESILNRILELEEDMPGAFLNLGVLNQKRGEYFKAEEYFNKAMNSDSKKQEAMNNLANTLLLSGKSKEAIKMYKKALSFGDDVFSIYFNMGIAYTKMGKLKNAKSAYDQILAVFPDYVDVLRKQAELAENTNNIYNWELHLRKLVSILPEDKSLTADLIRLLERTEQYEEAVQILDQYLEIYPQDRDRRLEQLRIYRKMGWAEVAVSRYNDLLRDKEFTRDPLVYIGLAEAQMELFKIGKSRDYDRAIYNLKTAKQFDPESPDPDILLGLIYRDYKKYASMAKEHFESAYSKSKKSSQKEEIKRLMMGESK